MKKLAILILSLICLPTAMVAAESSVNFDELKTHTRDYFSSLFKPKKTGEIFLYKYTSPYNEYGDWVCDCPWPWENGRLRNGQYLSSLSALNKYLEDLKNLSGQRFTYAKEIPFFVQLKDGLKSKGHIMINEHGDSLFFSPLLMVSGVFPEQLYVEYQKLIGKKILIRTFSEIIQDDPTYGFFSTKDNKRLLALPYLSEWEITDVKISDMEIGALTDYFKRFIIVSMKNKAYGEYYCSFFTFYLRILAGRGSLVGDAQIDYYRDMDDSRNNNHDDVTENQIKEWASKGDPAALFTEWKFFNLNDEQKKSNLDYLLQAAKSGHSGAILEYVDFLYKNKIIDIKTNNLIEIMTVLSKYRTGGDGIYDSSFKKVARLFYLKYRNATDKSDKVQFLSKAVEYMKVYIEISPPDVFEKQNLSDWKTELKKIQMN